MHASTSRTQNFTNTRTINNPSTISGVMALFFCGVILAHYNSYNLSRKSQVHISLCVSLRVSVCQCVGRMRLCVFFGCPRFIHFLMVCLFFSSPSSPCPSSTSKQRKHSHVNNRSRRSTSSRPLGPPPSSSSSSTCTWVIHRKPCVRIAQGAMNQMYMPHADPTNPLIDHRHAHHQPNPNPHQAFVFVSCLLLLSWSFTSRLYDNNTHNRGMGVFAGRFKRWHLGFILLASLSCLVARAAHIFPLSFLANMGRRRRIPLKMQVRVTRVCIRRGGGQRDR